MGVHKQEIFLDICKQDVLFVCVCQWSGTLSQNRIQDNIKRALLVSPVAVILSPTPIIASQGNQVCSLQNWLHANTCKYE